MAGSTDEMFKEKLESYLARACEAEAKGEQAEAEKLFRVALFYEAKSFLVW